MSRETGDDGGRTGRRTSKDKERAGIYDMYMLFISGIECDSNPGRRLFGVVCPSNLLHLRYEHSLDSI